MIKTRRRIFKELTYEEMKARYVKIDKKKKQMKEEMIADGEPLLSLGPKAKEFTYSKKQMVKLSKFGIISCAYCQSLVAEELNHCPKCKTIFRVEIKSKFE